MRRRQISSETYEITTQHKEEESAYKHTGVCVTQDTRSFIFAAITSGGHGTFEYSGSVAISNWNLKSSQHSLPFLQGLPASKQEVYHLHRYNRI